jgi:hypothetical protein
MVFSFGLFAKLLSCADNQVAHVQQGTVGTAKQANIEFQIKIVPADGVKAANWGGAETSVRRRFWAAHWTSQCSPLCG